MRYSGITFRLAILAIRYVYIRNLLWGCVFATLALW